MGDEPGYAHCNRISAFGYGRGGRDEDGRFEEWEFGLPGGDDLVPLSQPLIPPELAAAFRINAEPGRSTLDLDRAAQHTFSPLLRAAPSTAAAALRSLRPSPSPSASSDGEPSSRKALPANSAAVAEEADSSAAMPEESNDEHSARTLKRPRLVWTPQLHKRFVDVVAHLGIKNAVPKTIMQLMNVEGLTRENVASHLQKYRLYLKRMQGLSFDGPSPSDHLFASTPVPQSLRKNHQHHHQQQPSPVPMQMPVPYPMPAVFPVPVYGNPMAVVPVNNHQVVGGFSGFEGHHPYGVFGERPKDW